MHWRGRTTIKETRTTSVIGASQLKWRADVKKKRFTKEIQHDDERS